MSERIQGLSISLDLETAQVQRSLSQIKNSFASLRRSAQVNMNNMKFDSKDLTTYKRNLDNLSDSYERQEQNVEDIEKRMQQMKETGDDNTEAFKKLNAEYNRQVDELNKLGHALDQAKEGLRDVYNESSRLTQIGGVFEGISSKLNRVGSGIQTAGAQIQSVGRGLTKYITAPALGAATALGGIALVSGFDRLIGIDTARSKLSGLGHDAENVEAIMDNALASVKGTSFGMGEAANTAANAVAAGIEPGKELERYLGLTGDAAAIAGVDMQEMGSIFNKVQTNNKIQAEEMNQLLDRGIPIIQLLAEELGVAESEVRDLAAAGEISAEDFLNAVEGGFGGAAQIMGQTSFTAAFDNMRAALGRVGAAFLDAGGEGGGFFSQLKPLMADLTEMFDNFEGVAADWGVKFGEMFANAIESVKDGVEWFSKLDGDTKKLYGTLAAAGVAAGPILTVFGGLVIGIGKVVSVLGGLFGGFGSLLKYFGSISGGLKMVVKEGAKFATIFPKMGMIVKGLGTAFTFLTGPIGLTVAAIIGVGAAFVTAYNKSETFRGFIDGLVDKFRDGIEWVKSFGTAISGIWSGDAFNQDGAMDLLYSLGLSEGQVSAVFSAVENIKGAYETMKTGIQDALSTVSSFFQEQFQGIKDWWDQDGEMIMSAVSTSFEYGMGVVKNVVNMGITFVQDLFQRFAPIVSGIFNTLWPSIVYVTQTAWNAISTGVGIAMDVVKGVISTVSALIEGDWSAFGESLSTMTSSIFERVVGFFSDFKDNSIELINNLTGGAVDRFVEMKDNMINRAIEIKDGVVNRIIEMKNGVVQWVTDLYNGVTGWFSELWTNVTTKVSEIRDGVVNRFTQLKNRVVNRVNEIFGPTIKTFQDIYNSVTSKVEEIRVTLSEIWSRIRTLISGAVQAIWRTVSNRFMEIYNSVSDRMSNLRTRLNEIWTGIRTRITEIVSNLYNRVRDWFQNIFNNVSERTSSTRNRVSEIWNNLRTRVVTTVQNLYNRVKTWFMNIYTNVRDRVISIRNTAVDYFTRMKDRVVGVVRNLWSSVSGRFSAIYNTVRDKMRNAKNTAVGFATDLYTGAKDQFDKLVDGAKNMMSGIGNAIDNLKNNVIDKAKSLGTGIANAAIDGFNGLIKGINWVADKLGAPKIDLIDKIGGGGSGGGGGSAGHAAGLIRASTGLRNHKGGPVLVGDKGPGNSPGGGSSTREIVELPNKRRFLMDGNILLPDAPRGMNVKSNRETEKELDLLKAFNPEVMKGNEPVQGGSGVGDWIGNQVGKVASFGSKVVDKVKGLAGDILEYVKNPGQLFTDIVDKYVKFGEMAKYPLELAKGGISYLKDKAIERFKSWFEEFGSGGDGSHILGKPIYQRFGKYTGGISFNGGKHYGLDTGHKFDPLLSPVNGKVTRKWFDYGGGNSLEVTTDKHIWWFMHLSKILKEVGDTVRTGQKIAVTGSSGNFVVGTGHLHTQVHKRSTGAGNANAIDPLPILKGLQSHRLGGMAETDGLVKVHKGEYIVNPNHPTEAMKLIALAGKQVAAKSKQTRELPNPGRSRSDKSDQILDALNTLIELVSNKEDKVVLNVDGHTLAEVLNPHSEKIGGKNIKTVGRGLA